MKLNGGYTNSKPNGEDREQPKANTAHVVIALLAERYRVPASYVIKLADADVRLSTLVARLENYSRFIVDKNKAGTEWYIFRCGETVAVFKTSEVWDAESAAQRLAFLMNTDGNSSN